MKSAKLSNEYIQKTIQLYKGGEFLKVLDLVNNKLNYFPESLILLNIRGATLMSLKSYKESIECYKKILHIEPKSFDAHNNLGLVYKELKKYEKAIENFKIAISLKNNKAETYNNLGLVFKDKGLYDKAIENYKIAIKIDPNFYQAYNNYGVCLHNKRLFKEAIKNYKKSVMINPNFDQGFNNLGIIFEETNQFNDAINSFNLALKLNPNFIQVYINLSKVYEKTNNLDMVILCYDKYLKFNKNDEKILAAKFHAKKEICEWDKFSKKKNIIQLGTENQPVHPFKILSFDDNVASQFKRSKLYSKTFEKPKLQFSKKLKKSKVINIGYFSADFHNHATMYLMIRLLELHNKNKFKIFAFSFGDFKKTSMRNRVKEAVDVFHDVSGYSDIEIANLARSEEIHIALDLKGYTLNSRPSIFSYRAAPIQINYLGYPGSMGASFIDYIIADKTVIPNEHRKYYSEKIIYMPDCYQVNDNTRSISKNKYVRSDFHLPEKSFVFCCFNNNYKISFLEFDIWMRLLLKIPHSVIWLLRSNNSSEMNLKKEAEIRGVNAKRLIFADRMHNPNHLARHSLADLFLDTFNVNAHTTASDALWGGLPLVTLLGNSFPSRVSASLLKSIGFEELICSSIEEYEKLAFEIANNKNIYLNLKKKLDKNINEYPLFDTELFCYNIEKAYNIIYKNFINNKEQKNVFLK